MTAKYILRYVVIVFLLLMVAYAINLTHLVFDPVDRMQADSFWPIYYVTVFLIFGYTCWVNWVYNTVLESPWNDRRFSNRGFRSALYILLAGIPVIVVHSLFVHAGIILKWKPGVDLDLQLIKSNYWKKDFVYFAVPLCAAIALFYFFPSSRLFKGPVRNADIAAIDYLQVWKLYRSPDALLRHLRRVMDTEVVFDGAGVRLFDIVFILFENGGYFAILTNGEKCLVQFSQDSLGQWPLGAWFVKIRDKVYVNMLYVRYPVKNVKELSLEDRTDASLFKGDRLAGRELLVPSRRLSENVKDFLNNINQLGDEGWEEHIASK